MKHFILPQRFLFRCFTLGVLGLTANELIAQEVYKSIVRITCLQTITVRLNRFSVMTKQAIHSPSMLLAI